MAERSRSNTVQLKARMKEPLRAKLEAAAEANGVSLNAEMVHRLAQSFHQEAESGGPQLHGLMRLLVGAAEIIQARTGKPASDDWNTGLAVGRAWKSLIHDWLPKPPAQWVAESSWLSDAIVPERPMEPIRGGLLVPRAPEEEWEAYPEKLRDYQKELDAFIIVYDEHRAAYLKMQDEFNQAIGIGDEALGLLSDQEK